MGTAQSVGSIIKSCVASQRHQMLPCRHVVSLRSLRSRQIQVLSGYQNGRVRHHFCKRGCKEQDRQELTYSGWGAGGEEPCATGYKSLCCTQPPPYQNCQWYKHGDSFANIGNPFSCSGKCPAGKQMIASDIGSCFSGYQVYCCDAPASKSQTHHGLHHKYLQS